MLQVFALLTLFGHRKIAFCLQRKFEQCESLYAAYTNSSGVKKVTSFAATLFRAINSIPALRKFEQCEIALRCLYQLSGVKRLCFCAAYTSEQNKDLRKENFGSAKSSFYAAYTNSSGVK